MRFPNRRTRIGARSPFKPSTTYMACAALARTPRRGCPLRASGLGPWMGPACRHGPIGPGRGRAPEFSTCTMTGTGRTVVGRSAALSTPGTASLQSVCARRGRAAALRAAGVAPRPRTCCASVTLADAHIATSPRSATIVGVSRRRRPPLQQRASFAPISWGICEQTLVAADSRPCAGDTNARLRLVRRPKDHLRPRNG